MSAPVCPACGVSVLPGYVRCPKCRKPLPRRQSTVVEGGTALESTSRTPMLLALAAAVVVGGGIILFFGLRGDEPKPQAPAPAPEPEAPQAPEPSFVTPPEAPPEPTPTAPTGPTPQQVAAELEQALKRQRLWSTVTVTGGRIDVRSSACEDPEMAPVLAGAEASLKAAGLTKLRCVEQSGRVVADRDL